LQLRSRGQWSRGPYTSDYLSVENDISQAL